ncbi:MAG: orotidine-5'-phosphate decarboxylase [Proteobacteria bacterium]|nr:orotidine-5'-phosphate decarboxylase [Pseudomonadota bacterium]
MTRNTLPKNPVFVALDTNDMPAASSLAAGLSAFVGGIKLGLEFFCAHGPEGVRQVNKQELPLFLDLKLHDIPNTVAAAVREVSWLEPYFLTVHTTGGAEMMKAATTAATEAASRNGLQRMHLLGVTALTSLTPAQCQAIYGRMPEEQVLFLAEEALNAGLNGLVASAVEAPALRAAFGSDITLVTPGIRPTGSMVDDQSRVMTPEQALRAGADYLVIGRPITQALSPVAEAKRIAADLRPRLRTA